SASGAPTRCATISARWASPATACARSATARSARSAPSTKRAAGRRTAAPTWSSPGGPMSGKKHLPLAACLPAAPAAAGCVTSQDIEGLQTQIADVQRQMLQMQKQAPRKQDVGELQSSVGKQMDSLLKTEADMQVKLRDLSGQIDELQAKLEDTNYRLAQLSQQIAATNQELKAFRAQQAQPPVPAPDTAPAAPPPQPQPSADPQSLYNAAYNDYLKGSYDLSLREFQEYLANFPNTDLSDNATYWIGECYYRQKRYRQAVEQFEAVLNRYPRSDKA